MKLKGDFILMEVGGDYVAVPTDEAACSFKGVVQLNETAKDIFEGLSKGLDRGQIAERLCAEYEGIEMETAQAAVDKVIAEFNEKGLIEE